MPRSRKSQRPKERAKQQIKRYTERELGYKTSERDLLNSPFEVKSVIYNAIETKRSKH
jgi:hypothetical protein